MNVGTFNKIYGQATGAGALTQKGFAHLTGSPGKTGKVMAGFKAFGKTFVQNEFEEVVTDEFGETLGQNIVERSLGPLLAKADAGEEITGADFLEMAVAVASPGKWGIGEAVRETVALAPENAAGALIFSLAGAAGEGMGAYRSVKAAQAVASGKKTGAEDVQTVVEETKRDLQNPAFREAYSRASERAQEEQAVATELIFGEDKNGSAAAAAKATRQAEEARAKQKEGEQAARAASAQFDEAARAVENGDLSRVPEMKDAGARLETARKKAQEYRAIAERREEEAELFKGKRLEEARSAGRKDARTMRAAATQAAKEQREARAAMVDERLAGIAQELTQADAEFEEAMRAWSDAAEMGLDADTLGALEARMNDIGARQAELEGMREALRNPQTGAAQEEQAVVEMQDQAQGNAASVGAADAESYLPEEISRGNLDPVTQKLASSLKTHTGLELIVMPLADDVRGMYDRASGRLYLSNHLGAGERMRQVVMHELTHFIENTPGYAAYEQAALEAAYHGDEEAMERDAQELLERYAESGIELARGEVSRELTAAATEKLMDAVGAWGRTGSEQLVYDLMGEKLSFPVRVYLKLSQFLARRRAKKQGGEAMKTYEALERARDNLKAAIAEAGKWQEGQGGQDVTAMLESERRAAGQMRTESEQMQMALEPGAHYDYSRPFAQQVEDWMNGRIPGQNVLLVGRTPEVFRKIGLSDVPMTIDQRHMDYAVNGTKADHKMSMEMLAHLPELLENPIAIIESATRAKDSVVVIVDATINGKQAIAPIRIQTASEMNGVQIETNHLASSYGKETARRLLENAIQKENANGVGVYYIDKSRASNLFGDPGVQFPDVSEQDGLIHSIFDAGAPVNRKFLEQTKTKQFKRWFGESKVVDEDGKPLVVYHGTDADFDAFDMSKGRANMDIQGAFFSPYELDAQGYGGNVRAFYLKIENPASESVAYRALNRFKGQNNAGVKAREYLQSLGYDGVYNGYDEYIAFSPTQIKSADQNVGLFDPENPNVKFAVGLRQFGNKTAQRLDILSDQVKAILKGSEYEKVTNREQVERANRAVDSRGLDAVADELLSRGDWTAEDNVLAAVAMARAAAEGRTTEEAMLGVAYDAQGAKQGQALQSRQAIKRLSPSGAMAEAVRRAEDGNRKKGVRPGDIPVGTGKPAKRRKKTEDGKEMILPPAPIVEKIYDEADRTKADLDELLRENLDQNVSDRNPWRLLLNAAQTALIEKYKLGKTALPGNNYSHASVKERMLAAIVATPKEVRGDGLLTLCQQLEAMKRGLAVVTEADLNYISGQMSTYLYAEGEAGEGMPKTWEGKLALQRAYNAQANITPDSIPQKTNKLFYDNMLSNTKTAVKNLGSNALIRPMELFSELIGGGVDWAVARKTGNRTTAAPNLKELSEGHRKWASELAQTAVDYAISHADTGHSSRFDLNRNNRAFNTKWLDCYDAFIGFSLQAGDRTFWEQCYSEELATIRRLGMKKTETVTQDGREAARLVDMTEEDMRTEAAMRATERVFQEDSAIVAALNRFRNAHPAANLVLTGILPFTKTPMNIATRMMQYSPAGLTWAIVKYGLWDGKHSGGVNFDQRRFVMNLSRGLTGTGMMAAGMLLKSAGLLASGREDEEDAKRRALRKAKGESYGLYFNLGDKQIPVDFALPAAGPLIVGANVIDALEQSEGGSDLAAKFIGATTASLLDELFENSMLSGVTDLFRGYNDPLGIFTNVAASTAENYASRITPAFIRALAKFSDPYVRDTSSQSWLAEALGKTVVQYWPILRKTLPIKTDITGDQTLQSGAYGWGKESQNAVLHMLEAFATPWTAGSEKRDAALDELLDLSYRTGESSFLPGLLMRDNQYEMTIGKTLAKKLKIGRVGLNEYTSVTLALTDEEKRWVNGAYGDTLFNGNSTTRGLREQMYSSRWGRMSDEDRIKAVTQAKDAAKEATIRELLRRRKAEGRL